MNNPVFDIRRYEKHLKDILITIVVGTGRREAFQRFFQSLKFNIIPFELIVSDWNDAFHISDTEIHGTSLPEMISCRLIKEIPVLGHIRGYNQMFKLAIGHYIVWLNDDCELEMGWDVAAYKFLQKNEQRIGAISFTDPLPPYRCNTWREICYANFGFFARSIGRELEWFDETMHMYGADVAFSINGYLRGIPTEPIPGCHIRHHRPAGGWAGPEHGVKGKDVDLFLKKYNPLYPQIPAIYKKYKNYEVINL